LVQKGQSKPYDEAKKLLVKLKDLAIYQEKEKEFYQKLDEIKQKYSRRKAFISRLSNL